MGTSAEKSTLTYTRRLAAATGNPVGVLDESITTDRPTDAAGFPAVVSLDTNVTLARITGQTLQSEQPTFLGQSFVD